MIKKLLLIFFCVNSLLSFGQTEKEQKLKQLSGVTSIKEAVDLLSSDTTLKGQVYSVNQLKDTSNLHSLFFLRKEGDIDVFYDAEIENKFAVKVLKKDSILNYRVSYIFLDNSVYSKKAIDSLRAIILKKIKKGESFNELAIKYSMDGNAKNGGDLWWFEEKQMIDVFEKEVKNHKKGDVYKVDVPEKKWSYIVKNTYEPVRSCKISIIYLPLP